MVTTMWSTPEGSNSNKGNRYFAPMVNIGWKRYMGRVFLPMYPMHLWHLPERMAAVALGTNDRNENARMNTANVSVLPKA